ncbi:MAG: outer membrane beta-barrel protein [Candidatus Omnitrophota bacterium]|nr:outer membrane beta-barrel protein [Candidatus Omnitrophota bacterium]
MTRVRCLGLTFFALLLFSYPVSLRADFELIDAIQEFGEKRFVESKPSPLNLGPVRFHPRVRTKVTYDDNILREDKDAKQDVVWNIQPGVILELPIDTHQLTVGYEADMEVFSKSRDSTQNDQNQNFFVLADMHFTDLYINILDKFSETSGRSGTTFTSRIPRYDHSIHPKIGYRWKRAIFEVGFRHFTRDFRRSVDDRLDFQNVEWTGVIYYDLFARLKALVEYQFSQIDYDDDFERNGHVNQIRVGLEGEVLPNLLVKVRVGPHLRDYEAIQKADFNSWVADLLVEYEMREDLTLEMSMGREAVEATFADVNYYVKQIVRFGAEYEFWPKWALFSGAKFYRNNYSERATLGSRTGFRRDNHYTASAGLRYKPNDRLQVEAAYEFARRTSNFSTFDYTENRFSLTSLLSY